MLLYSFIYGGDMIFLSVCAIQQFIDINDTWYGQQNNENNKKYSKHFLPVSQSRPVNPFMQIHLYPFFWYKGMHLPVFLQGELSHGDYTKGSKPDIQYKY